MYRVQFWWSNGCIAFSQNIGLYFERKKKSYVANIQQWNFSRKKKKRKKNWFPSQRSAKRYDEITGFSCVCAKLRQIVRQWKSEKKISGAHGAFYNICRLWQQTLCRDSIFFFQITSSKVWTLDAKMHRDLVSRYLWIFHRMLTIGKSFFL